MNDYSKTCTLSFQTDVEATAVGVLRVVGECTAHQHNNSAAQEEAESETSIVSQRVGTSIMSDIIMRTELKGSEPMRFEPTSAKRAVAVHDSATASAMVSPINMPVLT